MGDINRWLMRMLEHSPDSPRDEGHFVMLFCLVFPCYVLQVFYLEKWFSFEILLGTLAVSILTDIVLKSNYANRKQKEENDEKIRKKNVIQANEKATNDWKSVVSKTRVQYPHISYDELETLSPQDRGWHLRFVELEKAKRGSSKRKQIRLWAKDNIPINRIRSVKLEFEGKRPDLAGIHNRLQNIGTGDEFSALEIENYLDFYVQHQDLFDEKHPY